LAIPANLCGSVLGFVSGLAGPGEAHPRLHQVPHAPLRLLVWLCNAFRMLRQRVRQSELIALTSVKRIGPEMY